MVMVEVSKEDADRLEKIKEQDVKRKVYNKARSSAITALVAEHKDEYDALILKFS